MSDVITQTAKLIPYAKRPKQASGYVTAYLYEPLPNELGSELGNLYVVIEVLVSGRASEELSDLIIETVGDRYYNHAHPEDEDLEHRFESAIRAVNTELGEHVNRGNAAWIGKLSAVIALQSGQNLHVSYTGSAEAFLYRAKSTSRITTSEPNRPTNPTKTFSSIATGQLETGDRLLLATPALTHQIALPRLQNLIAENSPNSAISEITKLLHKTSPDRIACLVIEITTPELAALKVRSEAPSEIHLGTPETPIEAAKVIAAPIAQASAKTGKKIASEVNKSLVRLRKRTHRLSLNLAEQIRQLLSSNRGRRTAAIAAGFIALTATGLIWHAHDTSHSTHIFNDYQNSYSNYTKAVRELSDGSPQSAQSSVNHAQQQYNSLKSSESIIDRQLATNKNLPPNEPRSYSEFGLELAKLLQQSAGYIEVNPKTIASFPSNAKPRFLELSQGKAYVIDPALQQINIITAQTGHSQISNADLKSIGIVKSTTLSPNETGIYLLTDTPAVWFYNFQTDSISKVTLAYDRWPSANAISAYLNNIYLLSGSEVYKYIKNQTGFSPGIAYVSVGHSSKANPQILAVNGSIYLQLGQNLTRYTGGAVTNTVAVSPTLGTLGNLTTSTDGTVIIGSSDNSNHLGVWIAGDTTLTASKNIELQNTKTINATLYDSTTANIYAVVDHRLVRFGFTP